MSKRVNDIEKNTDSDPEMEPAEPASEDTAETKAEEKTSAWRVMLGLAVIWGSLYLVAIAQKISHDESNGIGVQQAELDVRDGESDGESDGNRFGGVSQQLDSTIESLVVQSIPARQIVKKLLYDGHIFVEPGALEKIPERPISLTLENVPLRSALNQALGAVDMEFYQRGELIGFAGTAAETPPGE